MAEPPGSNRVAFAFAAAVVLVTIAALASLVNAVAEPRIYVEIAVYVGLILFVLVHRDIWSSLAALSLPARTGCIIFILLLIGGQAINRPTLTYPFVSWNMYSAPHDPEYVVYSAGLEDGTEIPFPFHAVVPTPAARAFVARMDRLLHAAPDPRDEHGLPRALISLAEAYNSNRGPRISRVMVGRCEVDLTPGAVEERLTCTHEVTFEIRSPSSGGP